MERAEAIKIIKSATVYTPEEMEALETLIPELRENENERIREAIESIIRVYGKTQGEWIAGYDMDTLVVHLREAFAYLEKQKEASKAIEAVDRIDKYIDENLANAHDMKDSNPDKKYYRGWDDALGKMSAILQDVYSDEKQKEQKSIEWSEKHIADVFEKVGLAKIVREQGNNELTNAVQSAMLELSKVGNEEWSEEDELMRTTVIQTLERFGGCGTTGMQIDWLKSLPERFNLQPKEEWSEEDEKMLNNLIWAIHMKSISPCDEMDDRNVYKKYESFLKSLRPQSKIHYWTEEEIEPIISDYLTGKEHYGGMIARLRCLKPKSSWKPSEEQMKALLNIEGDLRAFQYNDKAKIIAELYEQLKRL